MNQPADCLERDDAGDDKQGDAVSGGGQDLGALPAERPSAGCWASRQADRPQGYRDCSDVGEHVSRVG